MTQLIVALTDKTGYNHISQLINQNEWDDIFILTNEKLAIEFNSSKDVNMVLIDSNCTTEQLQMDIVNKLKGHIKGFEIAVNIFSGTGKEHMAILSALLKIGVGIRFVKQGKKKLEEL